MKGSDLLVSALENEGVERIFGVAGEENLAFVESLRRSSIELIVTRHEQPAAFMAATYGRLTGKPGVDMVAPFGTSLHVSGRDKAALEATITPYRNRSGLHWQHSEPSLEDVFIDLMNRSKDNFQ